jgi:CTP synthase (UTP-ammonia lyase)
VARSDFPNSDLCRKIALFCDMEERAVIPVTTGVLYEVPLVLENAGATSFWGACGGGAAQLAQWEELVARVVSPSRPCAWRWWASMWNYKDAYIACASPQARRAALDRSEINWVLF